MSTRDMSAGDLYERHARDFDRDRSRALEEIGWLDRFLHYVGRCGTVLDVGCGMGEPIAKYMIDEGFSVVGVDASPTMIAMCRDRFPGADWIVADMRTLDLGRRFDGIVVWDSSFHLPAVEQRGLFPRFGAHAAAGAPLMFTSGPEEGESIGSYRGEPLYHASLSPSSYGQLLEANGFSVREHVANDRACGHHTVWLATYHGPVIG